MAVSRQLHDRRLDTQADRSGRRRSIAGGERPVRRFCDEPSHGDADRTAILRRRATLGLRSDDDRAAATHSSAPATPQGVSPTTRPDAATPRPHRDRLPPTTINLLPTGASTASSMRRAVDDHTVATDVEVASTQSRSAPATTSGETGGTGARRTRAPDCPAPMTSRREHTPAIGIVVRAALDVAPTGAPLARHDRRPFAMTPYLVLLVSAGATRSARRGELS